MIAVLDASAAVRTVLDPGQESDFAAVLGEAELVVAPELMVAELTNTFWKYGRAGVFSRAECERGLRASIELVDEFAPLLPLSVEAFDLAMLTERPAYDMFYLVLARRNGAVLLTADESLRETARSLGIRTEKKDV